MDLNQVLSTIMPIAREAGQNSLRLMAGPLIQETKSSVADIVTHADKAAEEIIVAGLRQHFPDHHIVGEEGGGMGAPLEEAEYMWWVDPIDGTTNYANRIPYFSTSIALTDKNRQPLLGLVYAPAFEEMFCAVKGAGATLNGQPIRVTETDELIRTVLCSGFPYDPAGNINVPQWQAFMARTRGLRRFGSAALDLAYVACGRLDGFWEAGINPWDALGGMMLVQEAGGTVSDYQGGAEPQNRSEGRYVASNGHIHSQMLDILRDA